MNANQIYFKYSPDVVAVFDPKFNEMTLATLKI